MAVLSPFKDEEKGIGIISDIFKVKSKHLPPPRLSKDGQGEEVRRVFSIVGVCPLGSLVGKPQDRNDSPILV